MRRFKRTLAAVALATTVMAGTAGWAVGDEQTVVTGPPAGAAAWRADGSLHRPLPDPATASPAEVARFFATLTDRQRQELAARHPLIVGNLDGAPLSLRYAANRRALGAERDRQRARAADSALPAHERERAGERAGRCARLLAPGRQVLAFDPRGRGRLAEVHGDLAAARRTAVVVPGSDVDLDSFDRTKDRYGTPAGMARSLLAETARQSPDTPTAVIAWAGYTTPVGVGLDAATGRLAEAGAGQLDRFLAGLAALAPAAPPALFCHSYGSVLCGLAVHGLDGSEVADLVVLGSPGLRADSAADLHTGARIWATRRNGADWIGKVPHVRLFGLGHGTDPTSAGFGARTVPSDGSHGHSDYFAPGTASLRSFAAITLGSRADARQPRTAHAARPEKP
ncbi:alpha/beta hydrolase family protein [Streptomyces sp. SCA3-4]|uniref:alpha/beta hydrolase n=1 Tax=Streptomyces sichuanensis TaxID=2871810 RepID=UPI001CE24CA0|nr:alpha/beta hydrolase [Streptomyces sichuanensis]MCA6094238.1 alpha/beta hydrolase family protein [Streptomyces sichuanensis]